MDSVVLCMNRTSPLAREQSRPPNLNPHLSASCALPHSRLLHSLSRSNVAFQRGDSALHFAALSGSVECAVRLMARGLEPQAVNKMGQSAVYGGVHREANAHVGWGSGMLSLRMVSTALPLYPSRNASLSLTFSSPPSSSSHWSPPSRHYAAAMGHTAVVLELMRCGASANLADLGGRTPMHAAVGYGHYSTVEALVQHGAELECKTVQVVPVDYFLPCSQDVQVIVQLSTCTTQAVLLLTARWGLWEAP
jgi:ankyrin repeat protein